MATRFTNMRVPSQCRQMIRAGALVGISHSAGKDGQAMTILLSRVVPRERLAAVHAPLKGVEWPGTLEFTRETLPDGMPQILAHVTSGKALLDSIEERGRFPSPAARWCNEARTDRAQAARPPQGESPLRRTDRQRHGNARRAEPRAGADTGLEAQRAQLPRRPDVVRLAADSRPHGGPGLRRRPGAGQAPHPSYAMGMSRLSCVSCIMASRADLRTAARLQPQLYQRYVALERRIGHTLSPSGVPLPDLTGIPVKADAARRPRRRRTRSP
ncbi:MAG: hypothetical protein OXH76_10535 [Boseongicola sp.]|nr:hypothetical protein [Boseongicola sp.]